MAVLVIPRELEDRLGKPASDALAGMLKVLLDEDKKDMLARIDEKVTARYADIQRRVHEDIAGAELRLSSQMGDFRLSVIRWMVSLLVVQSGFLVIMAWLTKHWM